jgi:poly(A) polymerase
MSANTIKVLYRLHRSGYLAYLVGGGVRDILLGRRPKDFDVATNARPRALRRLFRNSRIIGRRFRLVHVLFRDEVVEVSTFRASPDPPEVEDWQDAAEAAAEEAAGEHHEEEEQVYGTPAEDARRRDFTVNGLFYNIADYSIIDYVGGMADLSSRVLRTIGDPAQRFEEDPVRMMRALEYKVRLGFGLDDATADALHDSAELISEAAPARLTYELLEGLRSGRGAGIWEEWRQFGLVERAFPEAARSGELNDLLAGVDERVRAGDALPDASVLGALFLPQFTGLLAELQRDGRKLNNPEVLGGLADLLEPAAARMYLPNFTVHLMRHALFSLTKMLKTPERGRQVLKLVRQDCFPVAWDLFGFATRGGLLPDESWAAWSKAVRQVRRHQGKPEEFRLESERRRRSRRRRPRRRRRRRST